MLWVFSSPVAEQVLCAQMLADELDRLVGLRVDALYLVGMERVLPIRSRCHRVLQRDVARETSDFGALTSAVRSSHEYQRRSMSKQGGNMPKS